jgi:hypothetical protein
MPASVPTCAALHTLGTTLRAGIVLEGDLGCLADLLDDQERLTEPHLPAS